MSSTRQVIGAIAAWALCAFSACAEASPADPGGTGAQHAPRAWRFPNMRPTIESADGRFSFSLRNRFQWDWGLFLEDRSGGLGEAHSGTLLRRIHLGAEGRAFRSVWYEYRMDFGGNSSDPRAVINIARLAYNFGDPDAPFEPHLRVNAGIIQPIFTHEDGVSSASLTFLERAAAVNVATTALGGVYPRRGVEITFQQMNAFRRGDNLVLSAAYTGWQPSQDGRIASPRQVLGRIAHRVWSDGVSNVQLGGSAARLMSPGTVTFGDRSEIRVDNGLFAVADETLARRGWLWGIDAEMNLRNVYVSGEYYRIDLDGGSECAPLAASPCTGADAGFSGWFVAASWILTGETKTYVPFAMNKQTGTFNSPSVKRPFLTGGGWGAWEVAARYSHLDLHLGAGLPATACSGAGRCRRGGEQRIWTFGLNWYLSSNVRMLLDYMIIDLDPLDRSGADVGRPAHAIGMRLQFTN